MTKSPSFLPNFYYYWFSVYEPVLVTAGFVGTLLNPLQTYNAQAPTTPSSNNGLTVNSLITTLEFSYLSFVIGLVNLFFFRAIRTNSFLMHNPKAQRGLIRAMLVPLLAGDILHLMVTLYAVHAAGYTWWDVASWSSTTWTSVSVGMTLTIPRLAWLTTLIRRGD
ncbi:hypothetical protein BDQ17DRAFT_478317 [Cyathus striatus]|nr:hypothetical protein BDQ17DRAFT_478317 [Cyathus striatus]